jgi:hypothetical protein
LCAGPRQWRFDLPELGEEFLVEHKMHPSILLSFYPANAYE